MDEKLCNEKMSHLEEKIANHESRISKCEDTYAIMEKMDLRMGNVETNVKEIKNDIKASKEQKGMKWDKLIDYLFYAILAYCLYKLGLKG